MKKFCLAFLIIILLVTSACESNVPLYKSYKTDDVFQNITLDDVISRYYINVNDFENKIGMNNGNYIKVENDSLKALKSSIEDFIDTRFDVGYLEIEKSGFMSLMENASSIDFKYDYKEFVKSVMDNKAIISVKKANILTGGYIREYRKDNKVFYVMTFDMILFTTALNDKFFSAYPFYNKGDTIAFVHLLCENSNNNFKVIQWTEDYNAESKAEFDFVLQ